MNKILNIGWKDLITLFRDRSALILMLAAPFVLTVGIAFTTGRFNDSGAGNTGLENIPVVIVNHDAGPFGEALVDLFQSDELDTLIVAAEFNDDAVARKQVDDDDAAAAVLIPAGFSQSIQPDAAGEVGPAQPIEIYVNPTRPISAGVVRTIATDFTNRVEQGRISGYVAVSQLIVSGRISPADAAAAGREIGQQFAEQMEQNEASSLIQLQTETGAAGGGQPAEFDPLAYIAPAMALLFLMYTVTLGGRTILTEREQGTMSRMLTTPVTTAQVLAGKVLGIFLTGLAQLAILILTTALLFDVRWGDPLNILILLVVVVAAATGWGILLAAVARTPAQVSQVGSALMLIFGILGGSFIPVSNFPSWLGLFSAVTPNRWGLEAFTELALGHGLVAIWPSLVALALMAAVLFSGAVVAFHERSSIE